jgi:hypothetical protein
MTYTPRILPAIKPGAPRQFPPENKRAKRSPQDSYASYRLIPLLISRCSQNFNPVYAEMRDQLIHSVWCAISDVVDLRPWETGGKNHGNPGMCLLSYFDSFGAADQSAWLVGRQMHGKTSFGCIGVCIHHTKDPSIEMNAVWKWLCLLDVLGTRDDTLNLFWKVDRWLPNSIQAGVKAWETSRS